MPTLTVSPTIMDADSSKEGHATDATALPMLRRETQELAKQVSKNLQVQMHLELQSFLEQLQANLKFHADGFGGCGKGPKADELRMSGLITQPAYTEPPFLDSGASGGPPTSDSSEKVQTPCRHSFHESTLLTHHRRGYLAQKEIENVLAREELETDIKKLNNDASHESLRMSAGEPSLLSPDDSVYYHKNRSKSRLSRQKTLGLWTTANMPTGPHRIAKMVVHSLWFDAFLGIAILANAVLIGLQTDWNVKHRGQKVPIMFRICDLVFCSIFMVELCLRLYVYRLKFYSMQGWAWNIFDTFIIIAQLLEESLITLERTTLGNLSFMRILRVFRLIRIIRLVRLLRVIGELRLLVCSVITSLKSLGWTILLIALMMYVNAIWLTQLVADQTDKADDSKIFYYYGSLTDSILSLFQSITSGIDWDDAMRPLVEEIGPLWGLFYCFYIAFSVFAMDAKEGLLHENLWWGSPLWCTGLIQWYEGHKTPKEKMMAILAGCREGSESEQE